MAKLTPPSSSRMRIIPFASRMNTCRPSSKIATGGRTTSTTVRLPVNFARANCCAWRRIPPGTAAIRGCNTTPRSIAGTRARTRRASTPRILAPNTCSLDDTACNLASLNLMKFVGSSGQFDVTAFKHAVDVTITAQEILVDNASYPTPRITRKFAQVPSAGTRIRESRRAADVDGACRTIPKAAAICAGRSLR